MHVADGFVAVRDIAPAAETHLLVLPERHVDTFRDVGAFPELSGLDEGTARGLLDEFRHHPQSWLACTARASRP